MLEEGSPRLLICTSKILMIGWGLKDDLREEGAPQTPQYHAYKDISTAT